MWYGDKYRLEPMVLTCTVLAFYLFLRSRRHSAARRQVWAAAAAFVFGTALSVKSVYLFAAPVFFVDILLEGRSLVSGSNHRLSDLAGLLRNSVSRLGAMVIGALWTFFVVDVGLKVHGEDPVAYTFFIERLRDASAHTSYYDPHLGSILPDFLHNTLLGGLSVYIVFLVLGLGDLRQIRDQFLLVVFVSLTALTALYAVVAL